MPIFSSDSTSTLSIITDILGDIISDVEKTSKSRFTYSYDIISSPFSQHHQGEELLDWDEGIRSESNISGRTRSHVAAVVASRSTSTVRNLLNEFQFDYANFAATPFPAQRRATGREARVQQMLDADNVTFAPLTDIGVSFPNQAQVESDEETGAESDDDGLVAAAAAVALAIANTTASVPQAPPPQQNLPRPESIETQAEKDIAESLRVVMAIIFENKDTMVDGDFLEATNLLKKVYEAKDPRKLKDDLVAQRVEYDDLYEEFCDISREKTYLQGRVRSVKHSEKYFKERLKESFTREEELCLNIKGLDEKITVLKEDIKDRKYDNDCLWKTKFHYQNKFIKLAEEHPQVLDKKDHREVDIIKKRKAMSDPVAVLDSLPPVKVKCAVLNSGKCKIQLNVQESESPLCCLFKNDVEEGGVVFTKTLKPTIVVENIPVVSATHHKKLCDFMLNDHQVRRLWLTRPTAVDLELDTKTGKTTGRAFFTFNTPKEASMAIRKSNEQQLDKSHSIKTYMNI